MVRRMRRHFCESEAASESEDRYGLRERRSSPLLLGHGSQTSPPDHGSHRQRMTALAGVVSSVIRVFETDGGGI